MNLEILQHLFSDKLFGSFGSRYGRQYAILKETDPGAEMKKVNIYDVYSDSVLIKLDKTQQPFTLFKKNKGMRRRCDYLLITKFENKHYLLFIEMKSSQKAPKSGELKQQFRGAECIVDYCSATLKRFHDCPGFFDKFEKRFVCFYKPSIAKRTTRPRNNQIVSKNAGNTTPEKMLKYPGPINPSIKELL